MTGQMQVTYSNMAYTYSRAKHDFSTASKNNKITPKNHLEAQSLFEANSLTGIKIAVEED